MRDFSHFDLPVVEGKVDAELAAALSNGTASGLEKFQPDGSIGESMNTTIAADINVGKEKPIAAIDNLISGEMYSTAMAATDAFKSTGEYVDYTILSGMTSAQGKSSLKAGAVSTVNELNSQFKNAENTSILSRIGQWLTGGLFNGMESNLKTNAKAYTQSLLDSIKVESEISSPSKLFKREIGTWLGLGIAEGIEDTVGDATAAAQKLVDAIQKTFEGISYNPSIDYMALMEKAGNDGNLEEVSRLEKNP